MSAGIQRLHRPLRTHGTPGNHGVGLLGRGRAPRSRAAPLHCDAVVRRAWLPSARMPSVQQSSQRETQAALRHNAARPVGTGARAGEPGTNV